MTLALGGTFCALAPDSALGLGSRIPNQDPAAIARGNAFAATADNPAALYYNPAGITQLDGHNVQVGSLFYLNIYAKHEAVGGAVTDNVTEVIPVPQLHYAFTPKDSQFSFGLGVYAPFGLGMQWPDDAPFVTAGQEVQLTYITAAPVIAWKPHRTLSIAVGPTLNYSDVTLNQAVGILPNDRFTFKGDDYDYGFTAGILYQPHEKWSFGASYRSGTSLNYEGTATTRPSPPLPAAADTTTRLKFPQVVVAGVSYRPTTNWNIEVNVDWTDWNRVNRAVIEGVSTLPLNWVSSFFYEVGVTRYLSKGYFISAGYFFSEASTPEDFYTPLVPDIDLHVGSVGFGYQGQRWQWAAAAQIIGGPWRTVDDAVTPSVNGRYHLFTPTFSISVGYRF